MPAPSISSLFMFLMTTIFPDKNPAADNPRLIGWENPEVIRQFKIVPPSKEQDAKVPKGLNPQSAALVAEYIDYTKGLPKAKKLDEIGAGQQHSGNRDAYLKWYPKLASDVNAQIDCVLMDLGAHPMQIMEAQDNDDFPNISILASRATGEGGPLIFGSAVANGTITHNDAAPAIKSILVHAITRLRKERGRLQKFIAGDNAAAMKAMDLYDELKDLNEIPTSKVRAIIPHLKTLRKARPWFPNTIEITLGPMEEFFQGILEAHVGEKGTSGDRVRAPKTEAGRKRLAAARKKGLKAKLVPASINDENDIQRTLELLVDHFRTAEQFELPRAPIGDQFWDIFGSTGNDLGVAKYNGKSTEDLERLLDFPNSLPLLFAKRHYRAHDEEGTPCVLGWHQLVCTASLVDHTFGEAIRNDPAKSITNMLLADDVGVGKTAEVMAYLAFLMAAWASEENQDIVQGRGRPPIIASHEKKSFMGQGKIPNAAHLVVVPNSVADQWAQEFTTFFDKGTIEIYRVPHIESDFETYFSSEDQDWVKSKTPFVFRILLCTSSAFHCLTNSRFYTHKVSRSDPPDADREVIPMSAARRVTLFTMPICTFVIDEIHEFRGERSKNFIGAVAMAKRAMVVIGCTATPLHSNPVDIVNIARILRIPGLTDGDGRAFVNAHQAKIKASQNSLGANRQHALLELEKAFRTGNVDELSDPTSEVKALRYNMVRDLQRKMGYCIIRRTRESLKPDGTKISEVPPKKVIPYIVVLPDWELTLLNNVFGLMSTETTNLRRIGTGHGAIEIHMESFLTPYRTLIACPKQSVESDDNDNDDNDRTRRLKTRSSAKNWPVYSSVADFGQTAGAKLKALVKLIMHHRSDRSAEAITEWDEENQTMSHPATQRHSAITQIKVLVYFSFSMMKETVVSALRVNGIPTHCITGAMNAQKRGAVTEEWRVDPNACVLAFSNVATTGLNMTEASIVIHYDVSWSGVYQAQIDGRAWRYGQKEQVLVYHLLARGTTDIIMNGNALEKHSMMSALLDKDQNERLMRIIYGETNDEPDESDESVEIEDDASDDLGKKRRTTKTQATKRGAASSKHVDEEILAENDDTEEEDANRTRMIGERKKKGGDKRKRKRKIKGDEGEDDSAGGVEDGGATVSNKSKGKRRRTKKVQHDKADAPGVEKGKNKKQANDNAQDKDGNAGTSKSHINKQRPRPKVASKNLEEHSTATGSERSDAQRTITDSERHSMEKDLAMPPPDTESSNAEQMAISPQRTQDEKTPRPQMDISSPRHWQSRLGSPMSQDDAAPTLDLSLENLNRGFENLVAMQDSSSHRNNPTGLGSAIELVDSHSKVHGVPAKQVPANMIPITDLVRLGQVATGHPVNSLRPNAQLSARPAAHHIANATRPTARPRKQQPLANAYPSLPSSQESVVQHAKAIHPGAQSSGAATQPTGNALPAAAQRSQTRHEYINAGQSGAHDVTSASVQPAGASARQVANELRPSGRHTSTMHPLPQPAKQPVANEPRSAPARQTSTMRPTQLFRPAAKQPVANAARSSVHAQPSGRPAGPMQTIDSYDEPDHRNTSMTVFPPVSTRRNTGDDGDDQDSDDYFAPRASSFSQARSLSPTQPATPPPSFEPEIDEDLARNLRALKNLPIRLPGQPLARVSRQRPPTAPSTASDLQPRVPPSIPGMSASNEQQEYQMMDFRVGGQANRAPGRGHVRGGRTYRGT